jgi:hypothetical protein
VVRSPPDGGGKSQEAKVKKNGKLIALLLLLILLYIGWRWFFGRHDVESRRSDPGLLLDRVWVDRLPEHQRDYVQVLALISEVPLGVFQKASSYRLELELFEFSRSPEEVRLYFPQSETREVMHYRIKHCDDLPPFDLCLDLDRNPWGGPRRYYGSSEGSALTAAGLRRSLVNPSPQVP